MYCTYVPCGVWRLRDFRKRTATANGAPARSGGSYCVNVTCFAKERFRPSCANATRRRAPCHCCLRVECRAVKFRYNGCSNTILAF